MYLRNFLKSIICKSRILSIFYNFEILKTYLYDFKIIFVAEKQSWSIYDDGLNLKKYLNQKKKNFMCILKKPGFFQNQIVHFGSQFVWTSWCDYICSSNKIIVTYYHGKPEDDEYTKMHIEKFISSLNKIDLIITSSSRGVKRLKSWGVPKTMICIVPIGVDVKTFIPLKKEQKNFLIKKYNIPKNQTILGSFQKDGVGWGRGENPKLIKGPDIFIEVVKELKKITNPFIILTGPARGFIIKELKKLNIRYLYINASAKTQIAELYNLLDYYFICSREEGGPKGLMESMACGVTVISNKVGMADTLIKNGKNGYLSDFKSKTFVKNYLLHDELSIKEKKSLSEKAIRTAKEYDWNLIGKNYQDNMFKKFNFK